MQRVKEGRESEPSAAIIDSSQSVKSTEQGGPRGYDAGKKVGGRKRHMLVDTLGLILNVVVHPASVQDRDGAQLLLTNKDCGSLLQAAGHMGRPGMLWPAHRMGDAAL